MAFCDQTALEYALGGASVLRELADLDGDGTADAAVVTDYLDSGAAEVRAAAEIKHEPETLAALDAPSLRRLADVNAALSARAAYLKGGRGNAMPQFVAEAAARADTFLDQLARGERRLGRVSGGTTAAIGQPIELVDPDENAEGFSIAGLKLGFR